MKKNNERIIYIIMGFMFILFISMVTYIMIYGFKNYRKTREAIELINATASPQPTRAPIIEATLQPSDDKKASTDDDKEKSIYTFLQGPISWKMRINWSGKWGKKFYDGKSFGSFGCGLCCLANVYSTISQYQCTPVEIYKFAKKNTGYGGGGAISWEHMNSVLKSLGLQTNLKLKPQSYNAFKKQILKASCSIALVSSKASKCYWTNTSGHYVTIFLYDKKTDTVFLADSGDPSHNRARISLRKIYKSLKTESNWQYLTINEYDYAKDTWKHNKAKGKWVRPKYF